MSYVFTKLNSALNPDEDKPEGTNIFAQPTDGQGGSQGGESANPNGVPKTSTETDIMSSGGSGSTGTAAEAQPVQMQAADSRVMKRNVGKVSTPDFATQIGSNLSKADQDLQAESDTYMQGATTQAGTYGVDDATLNSAVGGDAGAMGKTQTTLRGDAVDYEDFTPKTQYEFDDVQNLSSSRGLQSLLKNEARGQLSSKELEFDRGILERSPEFLKIREALKGQQSTLAQKGGGLAETNSKAAQDAINAGISTAKTNAEKGLGTIETGLRDANQKQVDERNAYLAELRKNGVPPDLAEKVANVKAGLAADYDDSLRMDDLLNSSGVDAKQFLNYSGDVDYDQMIDKDEAMKFNNIMQLLGRGGQSMVEGKGSTDDYTLDEKGLKAAIISDADKNRKTQDIGLQSEIDKMLGMVSGRAGRETQWRDERYNSARNAMLAKAKADHGYLNWDSVDPASIQGLFGGAGAGFSNEQIMTKQDADKLNALSKQLGQMSNYKAGGGAVDNFSMPDLNSILEFVRSNQKNTPVNKGTTTQQAAGKNGGFDTGNTSVKDVDNELRNPGTGTLSKNIGNPKKWKG